MSDDHVRLFVALELPEPAREALVRWRSGVMEEWVGPLRALAPEALHVTLCFLGWRPEGEVDAIAAACAILAPEPALLLAMGRPVWLPARRPRVLAVELEDREARLAGAQAALSGALTAGGWYGSPTRPYLAHVTVARVRTGIGSRGPELPPPPRLAFRASRVVLYRSHLSRSGARYEALARVELPGAGAAPASTA